MMEQYEPFSEHDFLNDSFFQDWVLHPDESNNQSWEDFMRSNPHKKETIENARKTLRSISFIEDWPAPAKVEASLSDVLKKINSTVKRGRVVQFNPVYRLISIAAVLIIIFTGGYLMLKRNSSFDKSVAKGVNNIDKQNDINPGGNKAVLTLADGRSIVLDSSQNGALTNQGGVMVMKKDGELSYQKGDQGINQVVYNTIRTPKGGQYQLVLADGSKVWLNAASSLKFPTAFSGDDRTVELTGEGYFEVAHDATKPFHVKVNDMDVRVLGTHFNINSYSDEAYIKTTLLEGRVTVKKGVKFIYLNPGQQAVTTTAGNELRIQNGVDLDEVVAWKNGLIQFTGADLGTVMRQMARWYDLEVHLQGDIRSVHISGKVSRNLSLSQVVKVLEESGIDIQLEGRTITATPKP